MKDKIKNLRNLMEKYDLFQQDDEVGLALKELEEEVDKFKSFCIYAEDFAENSPERKELFKGDSIKTICYIDNPFVDKFISFDGTNQLNVKQ